MAEQCHQKASAPMAERSKRGPKRRTVENSRSTAQGYIRHKALEPVSALEADERAEFDRLIVVLVQRGSISQVELRYVTEAARVGVMLSKVNRRPPIEIEEVRAVAMLTTQLRGLYRDMGLNTLPSRTKIHGSSQNGPASADRDPWGNREPFIKFAKE
jgi:hypothetical protein